MKLPGLRGEGKAILRKVFEDLIPVENQRIAKKGFNVPLGAWMDEARPILR